MKKSNKGFVPIMVKPDTKQMVKDLMPAYEDTFDATILMLLRDREALRGDREALRKALEENKKLFRETTQEIERLKKQIRGNGEVMEAEAGRE